MAIQDAKVQFAFVASGAEKPSADQNTIYFLQDKKEIHVGDVVIASPTDLSNYDDKSAVAKAIQQAIQGVTDNQITVEVTGSGDMVTSASFDEHKLTITLGDLPTYSIVKKGSANDGAAASYQLQKDGTVQGVDIDVPEGASYSLKKESNAEDGMSATYQLYKDSSPVGDKINVPKDMVIQSGEIKEATGLDTPYSGAAEGDKYIELTIANNNGDKIYIPVKDLVDTYTAGTGVKVSGSNEISVDTNTIATKTYADEKATEATATWTVVNAE